MVLVRRNARGRSRTRRPGGPGRRRAASAEGAHTRRLAARRRVPPAGRGRHGPLEVVRLRQHAPLLRPKVAHRLRQPVLTAPELAPRQPRPRQQDPLVVHRQKGLHAVPHRARPDLAQQRPTRLVRRDAQHPLAMAEVVEQRARADAALAGDRAQCQPEDALGDQDVVDREHHGAGAGVGVDQPRHRAIPARVHLCDRRSSSRGSTSPSEGSTC